VNLEETRERRSDWNALDPTSEHPLSCYLPHNDDD